MRKLFLSTLSAVLIFGSTLSAQLIGTKNIPGDYPTLDLAIIDLNTQGVGAGGVTLNLIPGNPQVAPAGGYVITATGTAANTITISGNNNAVTASPALVAGNLTDAIFRIMGGDYITIAQFIMQENSANSTTAAATNNMTEFGVALFYASATDGAQNNTIVANVISLNRAYTNTFGIYSNTRHTPSSITVVADITAASGSNSNNKVWGNVISNVNMGVAFIGSSVAANHDTGNDIGGASNLTGNTFSNWGGAAAVSGYVSNSGTSYAVFMNHQDASNVSFNTITSAPSVINTVTIRGIFENYSTSSPAAACTNIISNNTVTITSASTSSTLTAIEANASASTTTLNITNNNVINCAISGTSSSSPLNGIVNTGATSTLNITGNIVRSNTSTATTGGFTGISNSGTVSSAANIMNNQIGNASGNAISFSGASSGTINGISNTGAGSAATVMISGNDIRGIVHGAISSGSQTYITSTGTPLNNTITGNTFTGLSANTTGTCNFIGHSYTMPASGTTTISNNSIVSGYTRAGTSGSVNLTTTNGSSLTGTTAFYLNNNFSNITLAGSASITGFNNTDGGTGSTKTITGNVFNSWTGGTGTVNTMNFSYWNGASTLSNNTITNITGQGTVTGISLNSVSNAATSVTVSGNTINNLSSTGTGGVVTGLLCSNTSTGISITGNIINTLSSTGAFAVTGISITGSSSTSVSKNKIYDLLNTNAAGSTNGISVSSGTVTVSNNLIGDLRATVATVVSPLSAVNGINITGGTAVNVYYNTVYLNASSTGTNFGTSGINASTTPTVDFRNNLIVNLSTPAGTGLTVAYRRSSTTLTTYANISNNNSFYAGTPSATNVIFYDGTNSDQTLTAFQARVSPRDGASMSQNPTFTSTSGASPGFLHVPAATATLLESGGAVIAGFTTDYDNDARPGPVGSVNGGAIAPDIGADEFDGILLTCTGAIGGTVSPSTVTICANGTTVLSSAGASSGPGISYQWKTSTTAGGPYSNVIGGSGATTPSYTTAPLTAGTYYYILEVTCSSGPVTALSNEVTVTVNPNPVVAVSPTAATICNPGGSPVTLNATGATTYTWLPVTGLTPTTGATVSASPTVTTTYTVTGTAGGCTSTATTVITVGNNPMITAITATPSSVCSGGSSQLQATAFTPAQVNQYTFSTSTGATLDPMTGSTSVIGTLNDDTPTGTPAAIGFAFNFNGTSYTQYSVSPDGWILLGGTTAVSEFTNAVTSTTNIPKIYPYWDDLATGTSGSVRTLVTGTAPNRIFIVQWFVTIPRNTTGPANSTFQAWLFEADGAVEFRYGTMGAPSSTTISSGITGGATNFNSITFSSNTASTATANDINASAPASGRMYRFVPPAVSYTWTPGTFLNSTTISNPLASGITATTTYTATTTSSIGCTATGTVTITAGSALTSVATITPGSTVCAGTNITLNAVPTGGGGPYTYAWTGPNSFSSTAQNPAISSVALANAGTYSVTITDACTATSTATVTLTVNPLPTVAVTPTSASICNPGGSPVSLTATGATTYTWLPVTGLTPSTGATVSANPSATTTYTVTGTNSNGCTSTATTTITVTETPSIVSVTASPASVCNNGSSQLLVVAGTTTAYTVSATTFAPIASGTGTTTLCNATVATTPLTTGTLDDGYWNNIAMPFSFNYFGSTYNTIHVQTNCVISFSPFTTTTGYNATLPNTPAPNNIIAPCFGDMDWRFGGVISTYTSGVAPNRIFVINYNGTSGGGFYTGAAPSALVITQVQLFETSNIIKVHSTSIPTSTTNHAQGIENAGGTTGFIVTGRNNGLWTASNDAVQFLPSAGTFTYSWTPGTFLNSTTIANPMATGVTATTTYTVTASAGGCSSSGSVTLTSGAVLSSTASASPSSTVCQGSTVTLNGTPIGGGTPYTYSWTGPNSFTSSVQNPVLTNVTTANSGVYSVAITDACGITSTSTVSLTVNPLPTISVTPTTALYCNGGPAVALTATGGTSYTWLPAFGLSATTGSNVNASPANTITYTVTGTSVDGCLGTATTTITSAPSVTGVTATATPSVICVGNTTDLASSANTMITVLSSNFNTGTQGWTTINNTTGGSSAATAWTIQNSPYAYGFYPTFSSNDASAFFQTNSDAGGSGNNTNTLLQSPVFSTMGMSNASLKFFHHYDYWNTSDTVRVQVSTNASTWTTVRTYPQLVDQGAASAFVMDSISLNAYVGQPTVYVRYWYKAVYGYFWSIDNVTVTGAATPNTYAWSSTPVGFTSSAQNPTGVAPTVSSTYTVQVTNAYGCSASANTSVTVNPLPTVVANATATTICNGDPVTLSGSGATSYTWTGNVTNNVAFNPTTTDSYTVTGTDGNGCTDTDVISVIVNPLPTVALSGANSFCTGGSTVLTGTGGGTSQWYMNGAPIVGATSTTYTATAAGVYNMTKTNANGCSDSASTGITVIVNALPVVVANATATTICLGDSTTLFGSGATSYTWTNSVMDNMAFAPTVSDVYTVTGTDGNGCQNTDVIPVTVNTLPNVVANSTDTSICAGDTITLSGSGAVSYTWTSSVNDNVAFVPSTTDTYTVTGTDGNGCINTDNITVTVNALPTVIANATATTICNGDAVTLSGSGATTYTWTSSVTDNVAFNPAATDTYTVTGTDGNGCMNTDNITVAVNALPVVAANTTATAICLGDSVILTGSGAVSYTWTNSVVDGVAFAPTATDVYTVTGTDANGCMNTDNTLVTVNALPTVVANASATTVCESTQVTLFGSGAASYTWTGSVADNVAFTPTTTDSYTVTGTDANGCMNTDNITVTVNLNPVVTIATFAQDTICLDDADMILAGESPVGGTWSGAGVSGNSFDPTAAGLGNAAIMYTYTDGNGCTSSATESIAVDACTGIITVDAVAGVSIFPNPNAGQFTIQLPSLPTSSVQVEVMNELGQVIDVFTMTSTTKEINISTLEGGVYFVRVINANNVSVHRVVKQ